MIIFDLPQVLIPQVGSFALQKSGVQFRSPFGGSTQSIEFPSERWMVDFQTPPRKSAAAGALEAIANQMAGGVNRIRVYHAARRMPAGTMRGTPTLQAPAVRGAMQIAVTVAPGATLMAGDMLGLGAHLLQVAQDCQAVGTLLTVPLVNRIREPVASGAAIVWDRPTALFVCPATVNPVVHRPGSIESASMYLEEAWL